MLLLASLIELMIYIYALSLLFYFSDCVSRSARSRRIGTGLLGVTALLQFCVIVVRIALEGRVPLFSVYDFLFLFVFVLTVTGLGVALSKRTEFVALLLGIIGFTASVLNEFWFPVGEHAEHIGYTQRLLLILHIVLANLSLVALTIAAVFGVLYLVLYAMLKKKRWNDTVRRLPSLEQTERYAHVAVLTGTPLLIVSLLVAFLLIVAQKRWEMLLDVKGITTFAALAVYALYFILKRTRKYSGFSIAKWTLVGYALVILNLLTNAFSEYHKWNGG
ncbi:cytochrome c biogenesis protein CcsA [Saccharibacillus sp. CPCC 101409]|uniref:cytochrome c biogenesis protein CcsA n=1 Tax=Saccharibacillus sp. CPCC 101409 TaxID=3058041 RepID=UPI002670D9BE|nr:cytochrome c biogenesis protein CcsA [Saccharibacillus sp. CPCC 101409]MDO3410201.1 cytochrome c biogenesis protein CcsA [Saccharibacillus sp. CPCC 101409]